MNSRERFLATMILEKPDRAPLWEFGYWGGTIERWYREGLPKRRGLNPVIGYGLPAYAEGGSWDEVERLREFDVHDALGLDEGLRRISMNNFMLQFPGYIPYVDHLVPPDVSWQNFTHYRQRVKEMVLGAATA